MKAVKRAQRDDLIQAWRIGRFVGFAKLPPLAEVLAAYDGPAERAPMAPAEVRDVMALWGASTRGVASRKRLKT